MKKYLLVLFVLMMTMAHAYIVQSGDTLSKIARVECSGKIGYRTIQSINHLDGVNIKLGQNLQLPKECVRAESVSPKKLSETDKSTHELKAKSGQCSSYARRLTKAYPMVTGCDSNMLYFKSGSKITYSNTKHRSSKEALKSATVGDMFRERYIKGKPISTPHSDPGRYRNEKFFRQMYGDSAAKVRRHLTTINWFGRKVRVTTANSVHRHLQAVARDLSRLLKSHPEYRKYLVPIGGTFKWRKIAGTNRLSVHSFGAAIDINVKYSAYWRWSKSGKYQNKIPILIVQAFEKHGFIWGGKWKHFDTMHFEYRPEML